MGLVVYGVIVVCASSTRAFSYLRFLQNLYAVNYVFSDKPVLHENQGNCKLSHQKIDGGRVFKTDQFLRSSLFAQNSRWTFGTRTTQRSKCC